MTTQKKSAFQELASSSRTLNEVSDLLSQQLSEIETSINKFNLGVNANVCLRTSHVAESACQPCVAYDELHYRKHQGKWALVWVSYVNEDPENTWQEKLLRESPREIRSLAVTKLPDLLSDLAKRADELASETADRAIEARDLASSLKPE